jgi:hypothetical protein
MVGDMRERERRLYKVAFLNQGQLFPVPMWKPPPGER